MFLHFFHKNCHISIFLTFLYLGLFPLLWISVLIVWYLYPHQLFIQSFQNIFDHFLFFWSLSQSAKFGCISMLNILNLKFFFVKISELYGVLRLCFSSFNTFKPIFWHFPNSIFTQKWTGNHKIVFDWVLFLSFWYLVKCFFSLYLINK